MQPLFFDNENLIQSSSQGSSQLSQVVSRVMLSIAPNNNDESASKRRKATENLELNNTIVKIRMPRIPKSYQRRQYGVMFANVFNAGDRDFMWSYLDTFSRVDHMFIMKKVSMLLFAILYQFFP